LEIETEESADVLLRFKNGISGTVHFDYWQRQLIRNAVITGTQGTITWNLAEKFVHVIHKDGKEEKTIESYILEVFDPTLPRYRMKKRLGDYVKFLDDEGDEWQDQTNTEKLPILLFVCPRMTDLIYAKRRTRKLVADAWYWEDDDTEKPRMRFTTVEKMRQSGLLAKEIWEQA